MNQIALCPICKNEFQLYYNGYKRTYCSRSCVNKARIHTDETKEKLRYIAKYLKPSGFASPEFRNSTRYLEMKEKANESNRRRCSSIQFQDRGRDSQRIKVIEEQNNKCHICGIDSWLGKDLSLELDHIDGNNANNDRGNLRALCPNCHSLTPTWRGRNKRKIISDEVLKEALFQNYGNVSAALKAVNLSQGGRNAIRCRKLLLTTSKNVFVIRRTKNGTYNVIDTRQDIIIDNYQIYNDIWSKYHVNNINWLFSARPNGKCPDDDEIWGGWNI